MSIEVRNISKKFGKFAALKETSLEVQTGQLVALLGPSGSGKTTLLRIIAGLEFSETGGVFFNGEDVTLKSAYQRKAGFVFQHYALFQHMTVSDNIAFGLRVRPRKTRPSKSEIQDRVQTLLQRVQLEAFGKRFPSQLSGGQRQRVSLARALAIEPRVLLLDEPFGALDAKVRKELRRWLREILEETKLTSLFVTHDQEEAFEVADRVVVLSDGLIQQDGAPDEIRSRPANAFVNDFLGLGAIAV
jgi:sulfate transport system ATP-binding protein